MSAYLTAEYFTKNISTNEYVARFRNESRFLELCKQCPNYAKFWSCPPLYDSDKYFYNKYEFFFIVTAKIYPSQEGLPESDIMNFTRNERLAMQKNLLAMEKIYGGKACAFSGKCLLCNETSCTRCNGAECANPQIMRPSLEAYGFDVCASLSELLNIKILWGNNGKMPEYLVIATGLFHNSHAAVKYPVL